MAQITKISPQKKRDGYYNIFVDDAFFCGLSELQLATLHLQVGQQLTTQEQEDIQQSSAIGKTYNRALYYLQYGPRTTSQMRTYLLQKGYIEEHIDSVLVTLQNENYLNDEQLAQSFVRDRQTYKPRSTRMLRAELRKKGIDSIVIESTIADMDENNQLDAIKHIAEKKLKQARYQDKTKLIEYLLRQGFSYNDVKSVLSDIDFGSDTSVD